MAGMLPCIWASVTCREYLFAGAGPMLLFDLVCRTTSESVVVCSISGRWRSNVIPRRCRQRCCWVVVRSSLKSHTTPFWHPWACCARIHLTVLNGILRCLESTVVRCLHGAVTAMVGVVRAMIFHVHDCSFACMYGACCSQSLTLLWWPAKRS